jgi:hypothetical protein
MISWSRLLSGGYRDPLVGGHLLFGVASGVALALIVTSYQVVQLGYGQNQTTNQVGWILSSREFGASMANHVVNTFLRGTALTFFLMLLRVVLRRDWLAAVFFVLIPCLVMLPGLLAGTAVPIEIALLYQILWLAPFAVTLLRFGGLVAAILCGFVGLSFLRFPVTTNFSVWYSGTTVAVLVMIVGLTAYASYTALAGRRIFKAGFLDSD